MGSAAGAAPRVGAVVLAGGSGRRLGGVDKAALEVGGRSLLDLALDAVAGCERTVVVGAPRPTSRPVTWTREDPPGGGPAAGLLAGVDGLGSTPDLVVVLAVDMPGVGAGTVARLLAAVTGPAGGPGRAAPDRTEPVGAEPDGAVPKEPEPDGAVPKEADGPVPKEPEPDGAVLVGPDGRRQPLAAAYRTAALLAARPADPADEAGLPVHRLVAGLRLLEVPARGEEAGDVDVPADLEALANRLPDDPNRTTLDR